MLKLALPLAKDLDIDKVLITCDATNIASKKVIENNGGIFENAVVVDKDLPKKLRYWIKLNK